MSINVAYVESLEAQLESGIAYGARLSSLRGRGDDEKIGLLLALAPGDSNMGSLGPMVGRTHWSRIHAAAECLSPDLCAVALVVLSRRVRKRWVTFGVPSEEAFELSLLVERAVFEGGVPNSELERAAEVVDIRGAGFDAGTVFKTLDAFRACSCRCWSNCLMGVSSVASELRADDVAHAAIYAVATAVDLTAETRWQYDLMFALCSRSYAGGSLVS